MNFERSVIIINIIFDPSKNNIKITNRESKIQLNNLKIYIPKSFSFDLFAIIQKEDQNDRNLIKLSKSSEYNKNFDILKASMDNVIIAPEGASQITLFYFENNMLVSTNALPINIGYEDFKQGGKMYFLNQLSEEIAVTYNKIQQLTELNVQLYKDIREVAEE